MTRERTDTVAVVRSWYLEHGVDIHAFASRRVGSDLADDLLADTFRHAIESIESFDPERGSERVWLFGIATNLLRRHWRTEQRRRTAVERAGIVGDVSRPLDDRPSDTDDRLDASVDVAGVLVAVEALSQTDHELLVLSAWEQMSSDEVAAVLGIPAGTVRSRLHRIRRQLDAARNQTNSEPKEARP